VKRKEKREKRKENGKLKMENGKLEGRVQFTAPSQKANAFAKLFNLSTIQLINFLITHFYFSHFIFYEII